MALTNQKQSPIPVVPRTMAIVNADGTPTRSGQLLLQQLQKTMVMYGAAGDLASATDITDGTLFVVQGDNDEVLYQYQNGDWHYVAGTMWQTLNPDLRPKGLGPDDAGFTYRTIDSDPQYSGRTFVWSGSEWVETTLVRFNSHSYRLSTPIIATVNGTLWIETDRSEVIYQLQGNAWHYCAGTYYSTISPDQRPTDLGANDAGFHFRSTDTNPLLGGHEWIWSGSAWVEVTANRYGTHASRLAQPLANTWNGMLWIETDRGEVIYQNQGAAWYYSAGTMYGTLSPDQRPTDLGTNDAGFQFFGTDQQKGYYWSGSAWVATVQAGDVQLVWASANVTLTTADQTVPGASLTLNRAGRYLITGNFCFQVAAADAGIGMHGSLYANGSAQPNSVFVTVSGGQYLMGSQQWIYTAAASGQTAYLAARKDGGAGGTQAVSPFTSISALWVSP